MLANGQSGAAAISEKDESYDAFFEALAYVCTALSKMLARDGEGATKLIECTVSGAKDESSALILGKSVINSSLVKTAMFGADANWGRILCALGYADADFDPGKVDVSFKSGGREIAVCRSGEGLDFSEEKAKKILVEPEIKILIDLNGGHKSATVWGCDLSYDYVKINGDYRS